MKRYTDYQEDKTKDELTEQQLVLVNWTKYKIIVPLNEDKVEIMKSFKHFHDQWFDSNLITCNQLAHEYVNGDNIIVNEELFNKINHG